MPTELGCGVENGREGKILNFECWILDGRGRSQKVPLLNPGLLAEAIEGAVEMKILNVGWKRKTRGDSSAESVPSGDRVGRGQGGSFMEIIGFTVS